MIWAVLACTKGSVDDSRESSPTESAAVDDSATVPVLEPALVFEGPRPKNLLVVSLDTARRDRMGFFGEQDLTPNLTAMFSSGVVLEDHRSCSNWTVPSTLCAQTGRFPVDEDYWPSGLSAGERDLSVPWPPPDPETLASLLTGDGYDTTLVTSNSMFSSEMNGPAYGFTHEVVKIWKKADIVVDAALEAAATLPNETPWYLHVHFIDPHGPYEAPQKYLPDKALECPWDMSNQFAIYGLIWTEYYTLSDDEQALARACIGNVYGAEIAYWDDEVARLFSGLEKAGLLEDTLVVFWTDHGEQIGDHGNFQHGYALYDEENFGTVAFWSKGLAPLRWAEPTMHQDIAPTILEALGLPQGNHTGFIVGEAPASRTRIAFNYIHGWDVPYISAMQGDSKLIYRWDGIKELYDLSSDPGEQIDLYDADDPEVQSLWTALRPDVDKIAAGWALEPVDEGP